MVFPFLLPHHPVAVPTLGEDCPKLAQREPQRLVINREIMAQLEPRLLDGRLSVPVTDVPPLAVDVAELCALCATTKYAL